MTMNSYLKAVSTHDDIVSPLMLKRYPLWKKINYFPDLPLGAAVLEGKHSYRYGPENMTLPWALQGYTANSVVELGCGSGSLMILAAYSLKCEFIIGFERQVTMFQRLQRTLKAWQKCTQEQNFTLPIMHVCQADIRESTDLQNTMAHLATQRKIHSPVSTTQVNATPHLVDAVIFNPPFFPEGWGRASQSIETHNATHTLHGNLQDFLSCARTLIHAQGWICFLYDALRLHDILPAINHSGLQLAEIKYLPDTRPNKTHIPFRVWCFCTVQSACSISTLL